MHIRRPDRYRARQTGPLSLLLVESDPLARAHLSDLCACTGGAARVIAEVLDHPAELSALSANAARLYREKFLATEVYGRYAELLDGLARGAGAGPRRP